MNKRCLWMLLALAVLWQATAQATAAADPPVVLGQARQALEAAFRRLDAGLNEAARGLGETGLSGARARAALTTLCGGFVDAVDCAAVDRKGRMVTVEPAAYRPHEGTEIGDQEQVRRLWKTGRPVLSRVFMAVEGFPAVDAEYPVVTPEGRPLGSVSLLFKPEKLLARIIAPLVQGAGEKGGPALWVMEETGGILYDVDAPQIGQNLFTAELYRPYPGLIAFGRRVAAQPAGRGSYDFLRSAGEGEVITKEAHWQSVALYGTAWRLVAIFPTPAAPAALAEPSPPAEVLAPLAPQPKK